MALRILSEKTCLNKRGAYLVGASPHGTDSMSLSMLREQECKRRRNFRRERQREANARGGNVNNLAFPCGKAAIEPNPCRSIDDSARRLSSVVAVYPEVPSRTIEVYGNLLRPFPGNATYMSESVAEAEAIE
jgi:hypothetical protein